MNKKEPADQRAFLNPGRKIHLERGVPSYSLISVSFSSHSTIFFSHMRKFVKYSFVKISFTIPLQNSLDFYELMCDSTYRKVGTTKMAKKKLSQVERLTQELEMPNGVTINAHHLASNIAYSNAARFETMRENIGYILAHAHTLRVTDEWPEARQHIQL